MYVDDVANTTVVTGTIIFMVNADHDHNSGPELTVL